MWKWLYEAIEGAGYEPRSYSGRGMYGKVCLGVSTDEPLLTFAANLLDSVDQDDTGELAQVLRGATWDALGQGFIVYFPLVPWDDYDSAED